jgi:hypothetical protein
MLKQSLGNTRDEAGQATITIAVVLACCLAISILLFITMSTAVSINKKADTVQRNGLVIKNSGESIPALVHTNELASSILVTASPLEGQVSTIRGLAHSIDKSATSIDGTAATIVSTALGINAQAVDILGTARSIDGRAKTIKGQLDTTVGLAKGIKSDSSIILREATSIHKSACALVSGITADGHCP